MKRETSRGGEMPLSDWRQDFFDFSANARGRITLIVSGEFSDFSATLLDGEQTASEGHGETLDEAMDDLFRNLHSDERPRMGPQPTV